MFGTHQWWRKAPLLCKVIRIENLSFQLEFFPLLLFVAPLGIRSAFQFEITARDTGHGSMRRNWSTDTESKVILSFYILVFLTLRQVIILLCLVFLPPRLANMTSFLWLRVCTSNILFASVFWTLIGFKRFHWNPVREKENRENSPPSRPVAHPNCCVFQIISNIHSPDCFQG